MKESVKIILVAVGLLAIYHFFFRSISPMGKTDGRSGFPDLGLPTDGTGKSDTVDKAWAGRGTSMSTTDGKTEISNIQADTPISVAGTQNSGGSDNHFRMDTQDMVTVLR